MLIHSQSHCGNVRAARAVISRAALLAFSAAALTACSPPAVQQFPTATPALDKCSVAMQLFVAHRRTSLDFNGSEDTKKKRDYAIENVPNDVVAASQPECLKTEGEVVKLPDQFLLRMKSEAVDTLDICNPGARKDDGDKDIECVWNRQFRDEYPISFVFFTKDGSDLSDHLRLIRVYRNGELAYRWIANDSYPDSPLVGKKSLIVPGAQLRRSLMPHLSPIDIRVVGVETTVLPEVYEEEVAAKTSKLEVQLNAALNGALGSSVFAKGKLKDELDALKTEAEEIAQKTKDLLTVTRSPQEVKDCKTAAKEGDDEKRASASLHDLYCNMRNNTATDIQAQEANVERQIAKELDRLGIKGDLALKKFKEETSNYWFARNQSQDGWAEFFEAASKRNLLPKLATAQTIDELKAMATDAKLTLPANADKAFLVWLDLRASDAVLKDILAQGDAIMQSATTLMDDSHKLFDQMRTDVQALIDDDSKKMQLIQDIHASLDQTTVFDAYAENPSLLKGESYLPMLYADKFQFFGLAPWNGVAVRADQGLETQFNATNAIPIIDVFGMRWQFSRNRWGDFRVGIGSAFLSESIKQDDGTKKDVLSVIPELGVSIANFHIAAGHVLYSGNPFPGFWTTERVRFLIGVDLYKMISGRNIEAF